MLHRIRERALGEGAVEQEEAARGAGAGACELAPSPAPAAPALPAVCATALPGAARAHTAGARGSGGGDGDGNDGEEEEGLGGSSAPRFHTRFPCAFARAFVFFCAIDCSAHSWMRTSPFVQSLYCARVTPPAVALPCCRRGRRGGTLETVRDGCGAA